MVELGWNAIEKHIFEEEIIIASAPRIVPFGTIMLGPVLIEFGSEDKKILSTKNFKWRGLVGPRLSEPGAGSDLLA